MSRARCYTRTRSKPHRTYGSQNQPPKSTSYQNRLSEKLQPAKRCRMDIYAEILEASQRKGLTRITRISYAVGLPVDRTTNYIQDLSSSGIDGIQTCVATGYSIASG